MKKYRKFLWLGLIVIIVCAISSVFINASGKKGTYVDVISSSTTQQSIIFKNVSVFNGKADSLYNNLDVYISEGKIISIDQTGGKLPQNITVVDGNGKTLMPGLIDSHVHLASSGSAPWAAVKPNEEYNLQAYLYAGITTVYELGGMASETKKLAEKVANGKVIGPTIFNTHIPITVKNSHPIPLAEVTAPFPLNKLVNLLVPTIEKVEDAPKIITNYVKNPVDYVKITCDQLPTGSNEMPFELLKALIDEVHQQGYKAFVHIGSAQNAVDAVNAGADCLAHGIFRGKLTQEQAEIIAKSGTPIIYTLAGFENVNHISNGTFAFSDIDEKLLPIEIREAVEGENGKQMNSSPVIMDFAKDVRENKADWKNNFNLLNNAGVRILVGTDSALPGTYPGCTYYSEIDFLSEYGLSNYQILSGATYYNATIFNDKPNYGSIEIGQQADLLLLNGNPLNDINWVKNPEMIIANGRLITRK